MFQEFEVKADAQSELHELTVSWLAKSAAKPARGRGTGLAAEEPPLLLALLLMREKRFEVLLFELSQSVGVESFLIVKVPDAVVEHLANGLNFWVAMGHLNYNAEGVKSKF